MKTGFCKGNYCDASQITIPVDSIGLNRGYVAFDFMKVLNRKPFYTDRHLDRFIRTISLLRTQIPYSRIELKGIIETIVEKNTEANYGLKFFAIPLMSGDSNVLQSDLFIIPVKLPDFSPEIFEAGGSLITKEYARFLPEAKSTNYLPTIFWHDEIEQQKAIEVLYCFNNQVMECSKCNIFIVKGGKVFTPSLNVLKGITRSIAIDILHEKQIFISEEDVSLAELFDADEVFITSTTKKITPIVQIDGKTIGNGKVGTVSKEVMKAYSSLLG